MGRLSKRGWALSLGFCLTLAAMVPASAADPWLFVNDVHFDPGSHHRGPITHGGDTNAALLESTLAEMQRLAPHPPVIVMAGDFLKHHLKGSSAEPTMIALAKRLDRAFPKTQFVIALGNEDSPCGDYAIAPNSSFLRVVAKAWAPLVNRNGAAPGFSRTFPRDGFYTARLPVSGVRAVIADNAYWSTFYHNGCGAGGDPTTASLDELDAALHPKALEKLWLIMHIPPGIDASSTAHLIHHLAVIPFMRPEPRERVVSFISDPRRRIETVITGHVHRFSYRIIGRKNAAPVPLLVSPAVSPILGNLPSFLTAHVGPDGVLFDIEEHSYVDRRWRDIGGFGTLGVREFTGPALVNLNRRLERDLSLRDKYATLYMGDAPYHEIDPGAWRSYFCATTEFTATSFRDCVDEGGFSVLTSRGIAVLAVLGVGVAAVATLALVAIRRGRRRRRT